MCSYFVWCSGMDMFICLSSPTVFVCRSIKANDRSQPIYALVQVMNTSCADAFMLKPRKINTIEPFDVETQFKVWYQDKTIHSRYLVFYVGWSWSYVVVASLVTFGHLLFIPSKVLILWFYFRSYHCIHDNHQPKRMKVPLQLSQL